MTTEVQIALIVAIPPTVAALGAIYVTIRADARANLKLNHITVLTNSTLTTANRRIDELEHIIRNLITERDNK